MIKHIHSSLINFFYFKRRSSRSTTIPGDTLVRYKPYDNRRSSRNRSFHSKQPTLAPSYTILQPKKSGTRVTRIPEPRMSLITAPLQAPIDFGIHNEPPDDFEIPVLTTYNLIKFIKKHKYNLNFKIKLKQIKTFF